MPVYTYRREDGTTFDVRQSFSDAPLTHDPQTGQPVVRVVQPAGIIFKGSGFYVNDSKNASKAAVNSAAKKADDAAPASSTSASASESLAAD
ncbi:MAG: FmdB family zinc ribbon protein [Candidatus Flexifilum sp.]|jgi:putative FmdB family regulatory protein